MIITPYHPNAHKIKVFNRGNVSVKFVTEVDTDTKTFWAFCVNDDGSPDVPNGYSDIYERIEGIE